jgi:hypothetical protein
MSERLNAARVVQFPGYGVALLIFRLLAQRAADLVPSSDQRCDLVGNILVPLATNWIAIAAIA